MLFALKVWLHRFGLSRQAEWAAMHECQYVLTILWPSMSSESYRTTSWYDARVEIRPSLIQGGGMFARKPFQAGEIVAIVGGTVMTEDEFHAYIATVPRFNATQIGERFHLVDLIQAPETVAGSINHSCDANVWLRDEVTMVARRAIASGEEVTLDYALTTVEPDWQLDQPCQCGTPACRHLIRGTDWQLPDVQLRYQGHFAPFINERIRKGNQREGKDGGILPPFRF